VEIVGGKAHLNGISFVGEFHRVTAKRIRGTLKVDVDPRSSRRFRKLSSLPFIRGLIMPVEVLLSSRLSLLSLGVLYFSSTLLGQHRNSSLQALLSYNIPIFYVLLVVLVFTLAGAAIYLKCTPIARYHGAEHMAAHVIEKGLELTVAEVLRQDRIHRHCGTNLVIIILCISFVLTMFLPLWIAILLALSIGLEIFLINEEGGRFRSIVKPFYIIGGWCQKYLFTSQPMEREIQVAIHALQKLGEAENRKHSEA
jgi:uncharacterized protein YqhQ